MIKCQSCSSIGGPIRHPNYAAVAAVAAAAAAAAAVAAAAMPGHGGCGCSGSVAVGKIFGRFRRFLELSDIFWAFLDVFD